MFETEFALLVAEAEVGLVAGAEVELVAEAGLVEQVQVEADWGLD